LTLDIAGYESAMETQRKRSQESGSFKIDYSDTLSVEGETTFVGYETTQRKASIVALIHQGELVDAVSEGMEAIAILDATPFYGESGGQVGDCGVLISGDARIDVVDTTKAKGHHLHHIRVAKGSLSVGDSVDASVDASIRQRIRLNHSSTHLMHEALRRVLGEHVVQKGSLVNSERLRFDFSHGQPVTAEELTAIADIVNEQIRLNTSVSTEEMSMDAAIAKGATALFGEKYGEEVRVLSMGADGFSVELCGGTHVDRTGDIGLFLITAESGVAAGVRRIEAVTGEAAINEVRGVFSRLEATAEVLKSTPDLAVDKATALRGEVRDLEKEVTRLRQKLASGAGGDLTSSAVDVSGLKVLATVVDGADAGTLRDTLDQCKSKLGSAVILLAAVEDEKIALVSGVTKDLTDRIKAGDVMREVAGRLGGKGGGRPDMAQGGGSDVAGLPEVLSSFPDWVAAQIAT